MIKSTSPSSSRGEINPINITDQPNLTMNIPSQVFARLGCFRRALVVAGCSLVLTAWTAHADQLFASINGTGLNGGGSIFQYNPTGKQSTVVSGLDKPRGLVFDNDGNLFVATSHSRSGIRNGTVFKITPGGKISAFATFPVGFTLQGLAMDTGGNLFVVAQYIDGSSTIFLVTPDGAVSPFGYIPGQSFGLVLDSAGNLFATDSFYAVIYKFTPSGAQSIFADASNFPGDEAPIGLAFDSFGNLFVSSDGDIYSDILRFTPEGTVSIFAAGLTDNPRGLAFDSDGNLFVAGIPPDTTGDILVFTPEGTGTVFASGLGNPTGNGGPEFLAFKY